MIDYSYDEFFSTLGNKKRLAIVQHLFQNGPSSVSQISKGIEAEQSSVSHSLKKLLSCQYVHVKPNGKERVYSINDDTISPLFKLIDKHMDKYCKQECSDCVG